MKRGVRLLLLALVVLGVVLSLAACGVKKTSLPTNNLDVAKDAAAKVNLLAVQTGIQAYIVANSQLPSSAARLWPPFSCPGPTSTMAARSTPSWESQPASTVSCRRNGAGRPFCWPCWWSPPASS